MRGKVSGIYTNVQNTGITPAYAGKSFGVSKVQQHIAGSPPPMRGKEQIEILREFTHRITPAYAGKSAC